MNMSTIHVISYTTMHKVTQEKIIYEILFLNNFKNAGYKTKCTHASHVITFRSLLPKSEYQNPDATCSSLSDSGSRRF
jgi:hypothetical protein